MKNGVNLSEGGDLESLRLSVINAHKHNVAEHIVCSVTPEDSFAPNETAFFMLVHFGPDFHRVDSLRVSLTREEIDVVIEGLQDAKTKME